MRSKILFWVISFIITLLVAVYQRVTGPTYPEKAEIILDNIAYQIRLPRSHSGKTDIIIQIPVDEPGIHGSIMYRRYPTDEPWDTIPLSRTESGFQGVLPNQPPAGKLEYFVVIETEKPETIVLNDEPVIVRFKGDVPTPVLLPHILLIFLAMFISNVTGLYAYKKFTGYKLLGLITVGLLLTGGLILGPVIQKYAFGEYWAGFPFGKDLTDNKVMFAFLIWIVAILGNLKKNRPYLSVIAALVFLIINLIPHSLFGSELDYESGEVVTGMINTTIFLK